MMVLSALRPDASLPEFLAHRARATSARRLQIDLVVSLVVIALEAWLRYSKWLPVVSVAVCLGAYATWGLLDRARSAHPQSSQLAAGALEMLCAFFVALGIVATAALLFSVWAIALGTWIS
jgi:hypothetical protein